MGSSIGQSISPTLSIPMIDCTHKENAPQKWEMKRIQIEHPRDVKWKWKFQWMQEAKRGQISNNHQTRRKANVIGS